jgi:hypothetical protein
MRKLFFFVFIFCSHLLCAQTVEWRSPVHHDFGAIKHLQPVTVSFVFKNLLSTPLVIDNVRTTCGCTAPDWSEAPTAPGAENTILIEYDAKKIGYFEKKIKVYFDGVRKPETLIIEGEVVE